MLRIPLLLAVLALAGTTLPARIGQNLDLDELPRDIPTEIIDLGLGYQHVLRMPQNEQNLMLSHSLIVVDGTVISETMTFRLREGTDEALTAFLVRQLESDEGWQVTPGRQVWWTAKRRLMAITEKTDSYVSVNIMDPVEAQRWQALQQLSP